MVTSIELNETLRALNVISLTDIAADLSTGYQFLVLASRGLAILLFLKKHIRCKHDLNEIGFA